MLNTSKPWSRHQTNIVDWYSSLWTLPIVSIQFWQHAPIVIPQSHWRRKNVTLAFLPTRKISIHSKVSKICENRLKASIVNASFQGREQIDQIFHDLCWSDPVTLFLRRSEWKGLRLHHVCNNSTEHYHSTTPEDLFVLYISKMISLDHFSDVWITKPLFWRNRKSNCDSQ